MSKIERLYMAVRVASFLVLFVALFHYLDSPDIPNWSKCSMAVLCGTHVLICMRGQA